MNHHDDCSGDLRREQSAARRIAEGVRRLRLEQHLSLRTLASRAECSASFISQVEHGTVSPSIASLERIAAVLGVTLSEFFAPEHTSPVKPLIVRSDQGLRLASEWSRATLRPLGPAGHVLNPVILTLEAGGRSGGTPSSHRGEEFALVLSGDVTLHLVDETHKLVAGDAATLPDGVPHRWENPNAVPTSIVLVSYSSLHSASS